MVKKQLHALMTRYGPSRRVYESARDQYHRWRKLLFYVHDVRQTYRYMRWQHTPGASIWEISAELLFNFHKLEKGLCIPGNKRFFGYDPARATLALLKQWRSRGLSIHDPVYLGAIETLRAYRQRIIETPPERGDLLRQALDEELEVAQSCPDFMTPQPAQLIYDKTVIDTFEHLSIVRRSIRAFEPDPVPEELLERAVLIAQLSPSACNRQPCRIHTFSSREQLDGLLALQNGNRGFGHTIPLLLILTAEASCFFDASERHEPYVDGGLFAMSLILALQAQGLGSCCLNWCVEPSTDIQAHIVGGIPDSEKIIMFIAVGYVQVDALVPRSPRRSTETILVKH